MWISNIIIFIKGFLCCSFLSIAFFDLFNIKRLILQNSPQLFVAHKPWWILYHHCNVSSFWWMCLLPPLKCLLLTSSLFFVLSCSLHLLSISPLIILRQGFAIFAVFSMCFVHVNLWSSWISSISRFPARLLAFFFY